MGRPLWRLLLLGKNPRSLERISCDECMRLLEYYVDWILQGGDPSQVKVAVSRHLMCCDHCRTALEKELHERERALEGEVIDHLA
jgi:hypothetical protein